jgi:hypothetical protein
MKQKCAWLLGMGFTLSLWAANKPWAPKIEVSGKFITVAPAKVHLSPSELKLEIAESEGCEAKVVSPQSIQVSEPCEFLRGVYQYAFRQPGNDNKLKVYSEFSLHQGSSKSRVYLVNSPVIFQEGLVQAN